MNVDLLLAEAKQDYKSGKIQQALRKCRMALEIDPENPWVYQELAYCLYRLRNYTEAIIACKRALELKPDLANPHAVLGYIYYRQRDFQASETELRKALEMDPFLEEAYVALGVVLAEQGKLNEANYLLKKAIELNPNRGIAYYNLGVNYAYQGRYGEALREISRSFRISPSWRTGIGALSILLEYLSTRRRFLFSLLLALLLFAAFTIYSPASTVIFIIISGYLVWGGIFYLKSGKRQQGIMLLLGVAILVALYICDRVTTLQTGR